MLLLDSAAARGAIALFRHGFATVLLVAAPAAAQTALTHTEDAAAVPIGMLRFGIATGWSRYDDRFVANGRRTLDSEVSSDSLGPRQLPLLLPVESGLQTLTNNPQTRLTLGRLDIKNSVRSVITPITVEYGLTSRLTVGVMLPFVQTRRDFHLTVNQDSTRLANVGFVVARNRGTAAGANAAVYAALTSAADSLSTLLARCPSTPSASACAAVNGNAADAATARQQARDFADALKRALGTDSASALIAPRTGSALAAAIDAQRTAINARLQKYLGANAGATTRVFTNDVDFAYVDLQGRGTSPGLLQSKLGNVDSIQTASRTALTGITIGVQYLLHDGFTRDTLPSGGVQTRVAVGGAVRLEQLSADSAARLGYISPSDGKGVILRVATDVMSGRFGGTLAGRLEKSFAQAVTGSLAGDPEGFWPYPVYGQVQRTAGTVLTLDATPRYFVNEWIALDGHYGIERTGAVGYEGVPAGAPCAACNSTPFTASTSARLAQRAGFGVRYSTVDSYLRGRAKTPIEVSFTHLTTVSGDPGVAALSRDQIQFRLYFGRLRR